MTKSFDTAPGIKGSVFIFTTPGRAGIQWDEFGNGCMHKADSQNLPEDISFQQLFGNPQILPHKEFDHRNRLLNQDG